MAPKNAARSGLTSQNVLQLSTEWHGGRARKLSQGPRPVTISKITSPLIQTLRLSLNPEEINRAQALANITTNYQRPDNDLIEAMREKQQRTVAVSHDISSTESSSQSPAATGEDITPTNNPLPINVSSIPHKSVPPSKGSKKQFDWEEKARQNIDREELSLSRGWSRLSWKQKASNIVRLKLLKDDGYDITSLLAKGTTADEIIDALLAHIEARKQPSSLRSTSRSDRESQPDSGAQSDTSSLETCSSTGHGISKLNLNPASSRSPPMSNLDASHTRPTLVPSKGFFYTTFPIVAQKRKHTHEDDLQPPWHETQPETHLHILYNKSIGTSKPQNLFCTCGASPRKIARLLPPTRVASAIQAQAYSLLKWRISRSLFHSSRTARAISHSYSTTAGEATGEIVCVPKLIATARTSPKPSRIIFTQHASPATQPSGSHVYIGSRAFELIKREIQYISWCYDDADESYFIHDHDADDDDNDDSVTLDGVQVSDERSFKHDIRMSVCEEESAAVIEGEPRTLCSLMKHLRTNELFHLGKWQVGDVREDADGERDVQMRVVVNTALPMHLSHGTERALEEIEKRLEEKGDQGGDEVRVGVVQQCAVFGCT